MGLLLLVLPLFLVFESARAESLAGGNAHSLYVDAQGQLWAWGNNNAGQLGDVTKDRSRRLRPLRVGVETNWSQVFADGDTSFAIKKDGSLWAWGDGTKGQLGDGTITDRASPVRIGGTQVWDQVSARDGAVLAIRQDGTLWAWGKNTNGTLGLGRGRLLIQGQPARVGTNLWKSVATGNYYFTDRNGFEVWTRSFGVDQAGRMWTWGQDPERSSSLTDYILYAPINIGAIDSWKKVASPTTGLIGTSFNLPAAIGLRTNGTLWQWNGASQTFRGIATNYVWADVSCGAAHAVARQDDGTLWTWGNNEKRQLGRLGEPPRPFTYNWTLISTNLTNAPGDGAGSAEGAIRLPDTTRFSVSYEGDVATNSQANQFGVNYWSGAAYTGFMNAPDSSDVIFFRSIPGTTNRVLFSDVEPGSRGGVIRPVLAFSSLGSVIKDGDGEVIGTNKVTLKFDRSFSILSSGAGYDNISSSFTQAASNSLVGGGGHGVIIFQDDEPISSLEWEVTASEELPGEVTGFTAGIVQTENLIWRADLPTQVGTGAQWGLFGGGGAHTLALEDGQLKAWGDNSSGQCGGAEIPERLEPQILGTDRDWDQLVPGKDFFIARKQDGSLWAWGNAEANNNATLSPIYQEPVPILGEADVATTGWSREVAALDSTASNNIGKRIVAIKTSGTLKGWGGRDGLNTLDALFGLPWWDLRQDTFGEMPGTWQTVDANSGKGSDSHVLAVRADGTLWAWGANTNGQLGDGTKVAKDLPNQIGVRTNWVRAFAGGSHSLALRSDGTLWAWGPNASGQLGATRMQSFSTTNITTNNGATNTNISSVQRPVAVADQLRPLQVGVGKSWLTVSAGGQHNLALKKDRSLWAWGDHAKGQLGLGELSGETPNPTNSRTTNPPGERSSLAISPTRLGPGFWKDISAGLDHSLAVKEDGTLWAWGNNDAGQLGNGTRLLTNRPVQIGAANNWKRAWAGGSISYGLKNDGSLYRWGDNTNLPGGTESVVEEPAGVIFSQMGLGTLVLRQGGQAVGLGLISFQPGARQLDLGVQLGLEAGWRIQFAGSSRFTADRSSIQLPRLNGVLAGQTSTLAFSPFRRVKESPQSIYIGTARWSNQVYQAELVVGGDRDGDGLPDETDALPDGPLPNVVSPLRIKGRVDEVFSYTIASSVTPTNHLFESDLPPGLGFNPTNGQIIGTPLEVGRHALVVGVESVAGRDYQLIDLRIIPRRPVITSTNALAWTPGVEPFFFRVTATETNHPDYPVRFRARGLPRGLRLNSRTGEIHPPRQNNLSIPAPGIYRVEVSAGNREDQGTGELLLHAGGERWEAGRPVDYRISLGAGQPGRYTATGLPDGLTVHPRTGRIRGIPLQAGTSSVTVFFSGRRGDFSQSFQFAVEPASGLGVLRARSLDRSKSLPIFASFRKMEEIRHAGGTTEKPRSEAYLRYTVQWEDAERWLWNVAQSGLASGLSGAAIYERRTWRERLKATQPGAKLLAALAFDQGEPGLFLPAESRWWLRDGMGAVVPGMPGSLRGRLDFSSPEFVARLALRVKSLVDTGCVDGIYLANWDGESIWPPDSVPVQGLAGFSDAPARIALLRALREAVGEGWIVAELGGGREAVGLTYLDGVHLVASTEAPPMWPPEEGWNPNPYGGGGGNSWLGMEDSLMAFGGAGILRKPGMVFLEIWSRYGRLDPRSLSPMMTGLAMSLCLSDGAYLYADPDWWDVENKQPILGRHSWYSQWDTRLGSPLEGFKTSPNLERFYQREFEKGWAVYVSPSLAPAVEISFPNPVESITTGKSAPIHKLSPGTGDIFIKTQQIHETP